MLYRPSSFRKSAIALTTVAALAAIASFPAAAQQAASLTPQQCENAISVSTGIMTKYRGRISEDLARSFGRFRDSKCDLKTDFTRVQGTQDEKAFGEFRVLLIAMRTASNSKQTVLANQ
jgi:hypothetical protein